MVARRKKPKFTPKRYTTPTKNNVKKGTIKKEVYQTPYAYHENAPLIPISATLPFEITQGWMKKEMKQFEKINSGTKEAQLEQKIRKQMNATRKKKRGLCHKKNTKFMIGIIIAIIIFIGAMIFLSNTRIFNASPFESYDYYEKLGVPRSATTREIKRAFRRAALANHPDTNPNCKDCVQKMAEINDAYKILTNQECREFHDRTGAKVPEALYKKAMEG